MHNAFLKSFYSIWKLHRNVFKNKMNINCVLIFLIISVSADLNSEYNFNVIEVYLNNKNINSFIEKLNNPSEVDGSKEIIEVLNLNNSIMIITTTKLSPKLNFSNILHRDRYITIQSFDDVDKRVFLGINFFLYKIDLQIQYRLYGIYNKLCRDECLLNIQPHDPFYVIYQKICMSKCTLNLIVYLSKRPVTGLIKNIINIQSDGMRTTINYKNSFNLNINNYNFEITEIYF